MKKITCKEVAAYLGTSDRRIQQMCKKGEIPGAQKENNIWMIPYSFIENRAKGEVSLLPLPIGVSDYRELVKDYYYVDKTLLIKDVIDSRSKVSLFTRPRRFGKTLAMDMLRVFFEKGDEDTSIYFKDKEIWKAGEKYRKLQGEYPVIFLSLKDAKCSLWEDTYEKIRKLIVLLFNDHDELLNSPKLSVNEKNIYLKLAEERGDLVDYQLSLQILSKLLYKHYESKCVILIDEYDTPIEEGYSKGFYDETIEFMRNFLSGGLKDNPNLAFGFLTGVLKVSKESIFSGLNNIKTYSVLDKGFSEYFGFTNEEVENLLAYYGIPDKYEEVCKWYDGYRFGDTEIFNPWSVLSYIDGGCLPKAYWQSTGSNDIIGEIIENASSKLSEDLYMLLTDNKVTTRIYTDIVYSEIHKNPYNIFSFLLLSGYLRVDKIYPQFDGGYICDVSISNREIAYIYEKEIISKMGKENIAISIQQAIFTGDVKSLREYLEKYLLESVSVFDGTNESFYHGMMLGLCAMVSNKYHVSSNVEAGFGRLDIELCPINTEDTGFIFELKYVKKEDDLSKVSLKALKQLKEKAYEKRMKALGIKNVLKIGIAFSGKRTYVLSED